MPPPSQQQIFTKAAFELVSVCLFGAAFLVVHNQEPFHRGFYCDDESLLHPYPGDQQFPATLAFIIWAVVFALIVIPVELFRNSQIKKDMEVGVLEPGHQIWIYHDSQTDPCNLVARMNKYAHVVIYTGLQEAVNGNETAEIHEVVHVSKSSIAKA